MTSIHFQAGVRKANKKIDAYLKKKGSRASRMLETLARKATRRYFKSLDLEDEAKKDFYKGLYVAVSYYLYRGQKFGEYQEF